MPAAPKGLLVRSTHFNGHAEPLGASLHALLRRLFGSRLRLCSGGAEHPMTAKPPTTTIDAIP
jgi:hypothetical protein